MSRRTCPNCHANEWPRYRWCEDCWRAFGKGAAAFFGAQLAGWVLGLWLL